MKALSIKEPYASFIIRSDKTIETRTYATAYRGPLLIVTTKKPFDNWLFMIDELRKRGWLKKDFEELLPLGHAVAVVDLVNCRPMEPNRAEEREACVSWKATLFAWELEKVRLIKPFRVRGQQGLYNVDDRMIKYV